MSSRMKLTLTRIQVDVLLETAEQLAVDGGMLPPIEGNATERLAWAAIERECRKAAKYDDERSGAARLAAVQRILSHWDTVGLRNPDEAMHALRCIEEAAGLPLFPEES